MKNNRPIKVAITGIGMVTPLGHDASSTWQALMQKKSGIGQISSFDATGFPTQIAAEVKNFKPEQIIKDKKIFKYTGPFTNFALVAAEEALQDAGLRPTAVTAERWGLAVGSSMITAEFEYWQNFHKNFASAGILDTAKLGKVGMSTVALAEFGKMQTNGGVGLLAKAHNILGWTYSVHTACASGGQALGLGLQALRRGDADYVLAGGYDSMITPMAVGGFCLLGALSTSNSDPAAASRPFDLNRNGFVLGEGAAFLVLEEWQAAKARGARIYAELAGEGNTLSAYRITDSHPSGDGAIQAIQAALQDAQVTEDSVDYINAHGTSTKMNDLCETNAIKAVFGVRAKQIPISSTKSQLGHLISAAGAVEGAFCALAIAQQQIPMTLNLTQPDPECDLDYVAEGPRSQRVQIALSNSFGFGGTNNCLVFRHPSC